MTKHAPPEFVVSAWPGLMTLDFALAYTCLSEQSFRFLCRKRGVNPVDCEGLAVARWAKIDLDALIDSLPRRGAEMPTEPANTPDPADAALARVKARAKG